MNDSVECIRCNVEMEVGYIPDARQASYWQQKWVRGTFDEKNSFWLGGLWAALRIDSKEMIPVTALRCPKCGRLEFYADGR